MKKQHINLILCSAGQKFSHEFQDIWGMEFQTVMFVFNPRRIAWFLEDAMGE